MNPTTGELGFGADALRATAHPHPSVTEAVADWLGCMAMLEPADRHRAECGWCGGEHLDLITLAVLRTTVTRPGNLTLPAL